MNLAIDLLFVIGMEEISWRQRIFKIETPSVLETHNWKGEINFHNVDAFPLHNAYILVGFYGAFARLLTPGLVKRRQPMLVDLFTPPYTLLLYFFLPCALYVHSSISTTGIWSRSIWIGRSIELDLENM
jgi:hypothetical protein